jgi:SAM-dependent methyltransferase
MRTDHRATGDTPPVEAELIVKERRELAGGSEGGTMSRMYVHGYGGRERTRLQDQADALVALLHSDTAYPDGSRVLEAGCGVGAQTISLARRSPGARIVSVDLSMDSVGVAKIKVSEAGVVNVQLLQADLFTLPFNPGSFDHIFVCFVLEHLSRPVEALETLRGFLRPGGTITVIEGDHGSAYFHPDSDAARRAIRSLVELQHAAGGNALIGRQLYPLLRRAGFDAVGVSPRMVYVDSSRPELADGFTLKTFTAMIEGVRGAVIRDGLATPELFDAGIEALRRTAATDGVFCYTFFKAVGEKAREAADLRRPAE